MTTLINRGCILATLLTGMFGVPGFAMFTAACVLLMTQAAAGTTSAPPADTVPDRSAMPHLSAASSLPWRPPVRTTWQWQLNTPVNPAVAATLFDIDLFDNDAAVVAALHRQHKKVVCYINVGAWEKWRPDAGAFPAQVIGKNYDGWPGEKWLDIRRLDLLGPVMRARLDQCRRKGFDAVEPDNIDGYANNTGFHLTARDQLAYNRWLADEAHARGLSIGLKNDADQVAELLPYFDWALTEDCFDQGWCEQMSPFVRAGKAVFAAEYTDTGITLDRFCEQADALEFNAILKRRKLDAWQQACRGRATE